MKYWGRSLRRWDDKRLISDANNVYTKKKHREWCDINNVGITHFGLHPDEFRRDDIRFDIFHLRCAITRKLMSNL